MASACVNNNAMSSEKVFYSSSCKSFNWFTRKITFNRTLSAKESKAFGEISTSKGTENADLEDSGKDLVDFEFPLEEQVTMLSADELIFEGKLVPLQLAPIHSVMESHVHSQIMSIDFEEGQTKSDILVSEPYTMSPKAPRCYTRWTDLLKLRKYQHSKTNVQKNSKSSSNNTDAKTVKQLLLKSRKSASCEHGLSSPLLKDSDSESLSFSSRLSLSSSSSSGHDQEDLPRISVDSDKQANLNIMMNPPFVRVSKPKMLFENPKFERSPIRRASFDSPRMNPSGKIIFQGLERSSSSPGSFNNGRRGNHYKGIERCYSANVRISPVLNVPVCSLRGSSKSGSVFGLGQLFSPLQDITKGHSRNKSDRI